MPYNDYSDSFYTRFISDLSHIRDQFNATYISGWGCTPVEKKAKDLLEVGEIVRIIKMKKGEWHGSLTCNESRSRFSNRVMRVYGFTELGNIKLMCLLTRRVEIFSLEMVEKVITNKK